MYLFYMMTNGYIPYGTDGMKEINVKSMRGVERAAREFLGNRAGAVYFIEEWTWEMSELCGHSFECYIRQNGIRVA